MAKVLIGFVLALIIVPAIGATFLLSGNFPFPATAQPPRWERWIASRVLDAAVEKKAEGLSSPIQGSDDDLMTGMKVYRSHCAGCHGAPGKPRTSGRPSFYPPAPQLAGRGLDDPVPNVFVIVKHGIRYTSMPGWSGQLPDDDLWRVATFLTRVKTLPAAVDSAWKAPPPPPAPYRGAGT